MHKRPSTRSNKKHKTSSNAQQEWKWKNPRKKEWNRIHFKDRFLRYICLALFVVV